MFQFSIAALYQFTIAANSANVGARKWREEIPAIVALERQDWVEEAGGMFHFLVVYYGKSFPCLNFQLKN